MNRKETFEYYAHDVELKLNQLERSLGKICQPGIMSGRNSHLIQRTSWLSRQHVIAMGCDREITLNFHLLYTVLVITIRPSCKRQDYFQQDFFYNSIPFQII